MSQPEAIDLTHLKPLTKEQQERRQWEQYDLTLDLGCGLRPLGDVNIDLPRKNRDVGLTRKQAKGIKNFIYADWHHLPFAKGAFTAIVSRQGYWWEQFYDTYPPEESLEVLREVLRVLGYGVFFFVGSGKQFNKFAKEVLGP